MNTISLLCSELLAHIARHFDTTTTALIKLGAAVTIADSKGATGDIATNAAMTLARVEKKSPRVIAEEIVSLLTEESGPFDVIENIEIAGPGFINITLKPSTWLDTLNHIITHKELSLTPIVPQESYYLEFVSANPTGPLHLGHGRNAILGDTLQRVLRALGHDVFSEFYVNDAGVQMNKLGNSVKARALAEVGQSVTFPEDGYHGDYIIDIAKQCLAEHGNDVVNNDGSFFTSYAMKIIMKEQESDLSCYGVHFDNWFSEKTLHEQELIPEALEALKNHGYVYELDGATWFKATKFGDDKDRVLKKADGSYTYISPDIAYHHHKFKTNRSKIINILGQDHHGYVQRLTGTMKALGHDTEKLNVILYQLVSLKKGDEAVKMSKRAGTFTTVKDIIDIVGVDAARFFFLHKKADSHLELDVDVALKQSSDNPVFYLQYAYVRTNSVLAKAPADVAEISSEYTPAEQAIIKKMVQMVEVLGAIGKTLQVHALAQYGLDLATAFHSFYANNKIICDDEQATARRLKLTKAVQIALGVVHDMLGLTKRDSM